MAPITDEMEEILSRRSTVPDRQKLGEIIKQLKGESSYARARQLLTFVLETQPIPWAAQQLALCTYKDEELPTAKRLRDALVILEERLHLRSPDTRDAETLALGGGVHKRLWEHTGQLEHLHEALAFYRAANERDWRNDKGYGGVNAAFLLDVLAARARAQARRTGTAGDVTVAFQQDAETLRAKLERELTTLAAENASLTRDYFFVVTQAEVAFGLGKYDDAARLLAQARTLAPSTWELQTTFRQLVTIARLQGHPPPKEGQPIGDWARPWQAVAALLEHGAESALSCYRGKVGLALSGGGFRASFFHLGVLARLAEMDVLRSVEVLSTVSGGSIVGAQYYLEIQQLLESSPDHTITRQSYLDIVRRLQRNFLLGVQRNLRMHALADWQASGRMIFDSSFTRSNRMGELYEEHLYRSVAAPPASGTTTTAPAVDGQPLPRHVPGQARRMPELLILPAIDDQGTQDVSFKPLFDNWRRRAKAPQLLINATSLNSGHLWHFTASWMGEPPGLIDPVDVNRRYRRLWYRQAPTPALRDYRLGHAVAASACVPGLFDPLVISDLYPDRTVRLVDGGVHDNQGVAGLLNEGCSFVLCSDASGQMDDIATPPGGLLAPLARSSQAIFMDRIREAQYQDLQGRVDASALSGLFFIHLKQQLPSPPINWVGCADAQTSPESRRTDYGIDVDLQRQLAEIRTDLDSFTEVEAYTLMLSGYLMTERETKRLQAEHARTGAQTSWGDFDIDAPREDWPFLAPLESIVAKAPDDPDPRRQDLGRQLAASSSLFFKAWQLCPDVQRSVRTAAVVVGLLWLAGSGFSPTAIARQALLIGGSLLAIGGAAAATTAWNWLFPARPVHNYIGKTAGMLAGWIIAQLHLRFFDARYLERGRLDRLLSLGAPPSAPDEPAPLTGSAV